MKTFPDAVKSFLDASRAEWGSPGAQKAMKREGITPNRTMETLRNEKDWVAQQARDVRQGNVGRGRQTAGDGRHEARERAHEVSERRPAQRLPVAEFLFAQGRCARPLGGVLQQELRKGRGHRGLHRWCGCPGQGRPGACARRACGTCGRRQCKN